MTDLLKLSAAEARAALDNKDFTAVELTEAYLKAAEATSALNAYTEVTPDKALEMAKASDVRLQKGEGGMLEGLPIGVKDLFCTEGVETTACSNILNGYKPVYESTVTQNLWNDGAVMLGKLNCDEFAMGSANETSARGSVASPWRPDGDDKDYAPGGSSGGSAASVAAHSSIMATGTDTGGSIRQPAAFCGVVGLKPTYGRCSRRGIVAFASSLDQAGPITRTVKDSAMMLQSMVSHDPGDSTSVAEPMGDLRADLDAGVKGMKIGIPSEYTMDGMDAEIIKQWENGRRWLEDAGATCVEVSLPHTQYALPTYYIVAPAEASSNLARYDGVRYGQRIPGDSLDDMYAKTRAEGFGDEVTRRILIGTYVLSAGYYDAYYLKAQKTRRLIQNDFIAAFENVDALLTPATPSAAFPIGQKDVDPVTMYLNDVFTVPASLAGVPAMSVPSGLSENGMPLGLQVIAPSFREDTLIKAGRVLEKGSGIYGNRQPRGRSIIMTEENKNLVEGRTGLWEVVIGLEVHAQVTSQSKLFSGSSASFGAGPNEHVSLVDAAMPGMLPVINKFCVEQAVKTGLGLNAEVNLFSVFDRKNYFYADLPQGYQISQYKQPIIGEGEITIDLKDGSSRTIGIERLHLEQDAGKSMHDQHPSKSYIDLNRSGVALMEIVSRPDMRSAEEAGAYVSKLRSILRFLGTCDGNMEEGSMRADVNVSVRRPGEEFGTRTETKNLNSIRFIGQAINAEVARQIEILEDGGEIDQETRLFDTSTGTTRSMRSKEDAHDYRYFPDPDLLPLVLEQDWVDSLKEGLPELPDALKARLIDQYGLTPYDATVISEDLETAAFYEKVAAGRDAKLAANWMTVELFGALNKMGKDLAESPISPEQLGALVGLIGDGTISGRIAKDVFAEMVENGGDPEAIIEEKGLKQVSDTGAIEAMIDDVIANNQDKVDEYRGGKDKLFGFFVGQVMKASKGQANPGMVNQMLKAKLDG